jgi:hypothetical protein
MVNCTQYKQDLHIKKYGTSPVQGGRHASTSSSERQRETQVMEGSTLKALNHTAMRSMVCIKSAGAASSVGSFGSLDLVGSFGSPTN